MKPKLSDLRCVGCGSDACIAVDPGYEPQRSDMPLFDVLLERGRPSVGRCLSCLCAQFPGLNRAEAAHG